MNRSETDGLSKRQRKSKREGKLGRDVNGELPAEKKDSKGAVKKEKEGKEIE